MWKGSTCLELGVHLCPHPFSRYTGLLHSSELPALQLSFRVFSEGVWFWGGLNPAYSLFCFSVWGLEVGFDPQVGQELFFFFLVLYFLS